MARQAAQLESPVVSPSDIALTGIYEVSKILNTSSRLETTLSNVVNL